MLLSVHPRFARAIVNRLWKQFYGIGLSKGLIDMGSRGEVPPNQELLDWLAVEFIKRGWSVNLGRKTALLAAALCIVPTMFAPAAGNMWVAVGIVSLAAGAHPFDQTFNARLQSHYDAVNKVFAAGKYLGNTPEQVALSPSANTGPWRR